jgi:2-oxo-3-hexenedioate decarboxylase
MNLHDIAKEVLEVLGTGRQLDPFSKVYPDFGLKDAYNVTATVRAQREARGERSIGRKIGSPTVEICSISCLKQIKSIA